MSQSFIEIDPGSATLEALVDKVFYGVKQFSDTGRVVIEKIAGDEPIRLPNEYSITNADYVNWVWTYNTFQFSWENDGHLLLEVL